jgi:hypothetical protein
MSKFERNFLRGFRTFFETRFSIVQVLLAVVIFDSEGPLWAKIAPTFILWVLVGLLQPYVGKMLDRVEAELDHTNDPAG